MFISRFIPLYKHDHPLSDINRSVQRMQSTRDLHITSSRRLFSELAIICTRALFTVSLLRNIAL